MTFTWPFRGADRIARFRAVIVTPAIVAGGVLVGAGSAATSRHSSTSGASSWERDSRAAQTRRALAASEPELDAYPASTSLAATAGMDLVLHVPTMNAAKVVLFVPAGYEMRIGQQLGSEVRLASFWSGHLGSLGAITAADPSTYVGDWSALIITLAFLALVGTLWLHERRAHADGMRADAIFFVAAALLVSHRFLKEVKTTWYELSNATRQAHAPMYPQAPPRADGATSTALTRRSRGHVWTGTRRRLRRSRPSLGALLLHCVLERVDVEDSPLVGHEIA
jgi:hypothetical protein